MLKLIVFDWDGTLADSVKKIVECKRSIAKKYSLPMPSEELIKNVLGEKFEDAMRKCFPTTTAEMLTILSGDFDRLIQEEKHQALTFPHVSTVLNILKKRGFILAVATSKTRKWLDRAIKYNKLHSIFDVTCCGEEYKDKPNPAMLNYLLKKYSLLPSECIMIGDTTTDILFAHNAHVKTVAVAFGAHNIEKLKILNPVACIYAWPQLFEIIEKLC